LSITRRKKLNDFNIFGVRKQSYFALHKVVQGYNSGEVGEFIIFLREISSEYCVPNIIKIDLVCYRVIQTMKRETFFSRHSVYASYVNFLSFYLFPQGRATIKSDLCLITSNSFETYRDLKTLAAQIVALIHTALFTK